MNWKPPKDQDYKDRLKENMDKAESQSHTALDYVQSGGI